MKEELFFQLNTKVRLSEARILLKDVAKIYCPNKSIMDKVNLLVIHHRSKKEEAVCVINGLKIISMIKDKYPDLNIISVGETEVIIEWVKEKRTPPWIDMAKIIIISSLCFCGTVFTIMGYHYDISIDLIFSRLKEALGREADSGWSMLEISYSIGLSLGIIIFYNHIGGRKLSGDPTPIAVEMRSYEREVNQCLVELSDREEKTIDVN